MPAADQASRASAATVPVADHSHLKSRLSAMRGFKQDRSARLVIAGHAFLQNIRRGHTSLLSTAGEPASGGRLRRAGLAI